MKYLIACLPGTVAALFCCMADAQNAQSPALARVALNIDPQPVRAALKQFGEQSGLQVLMRVDDVSVDGVIASPVEGDLTVRTALNRLLADTGLKFEFVNDRTIRISRVDSAAPMPIKNVDQKEASVEAPIHSEPVPAGNSASNSESKPPKRPTVETDNGGRKALEEVIVTAQKREERLTDVPVPVTVIHARELVERHQFRLQDYYTQVPGLNLVSRSEGGSGISIRGVQTGGTLNPTTSIVVDDVPFGASGAAEVSGNLLYATDFDPSELARVEVLRGPQGTLYGASNMGGLVKFVTVDPTLDGFSGRLQVGTSWVEKGDDIGYLVQAAVNVPLSDAWAVRLSASGRRDPGYIDNIQAGQDDVNQLDAQTVRLATLWQPFDGLKVKLGALYQNMELGGANDVHLPAPIGPLPTIGDLEQNVLIDTGRLEQEFIAYTAAVTAALGRTELVSLTGYSSNGIDTAADVSPVRPQTFGLFGVRGTVARSHPNVYKFSQELRLTFTLGERFEWLLGGFYTRESTPLQSENLAINPANGNVAGLVLQNDIDSTYDERAVFTNVTYKITDRFDVQAGLRVSRIETTFDAIARGPLNALSGRPDPFVVPHLVAEDDAVTYSVTPRFRLSRDWMLYGRAASGYRPGGFNTDPRTIPLGLPLTYDHDTTENFELGLKGESGGGRFSLDASIYYIDWKDVQTQLRDTLTAVVYNFNVGRAKSEGVELSVDVRPVDGLTLRAWGAYNNAELTEVPTSSNLTARAGDRLPYSARWSGHLAVSQEFPLTSETMAVIGSSFSYVGDRKGRFFRGVPQGTFPSYTQLDLQAGLRSRAWSVQAFLNNVTDKRGVLRNGRDSALALLYVDTYTQPRTGGLQLSYNW